MAEGQAAGIILAGGLSRRMGGGDKALLDLCGRPMIAHVIERLGCARAISANSGAEALAAFGLPVLPDSVPDRPGPLAGMLAGMDWAAAQGLTRIVTAPADTPFFPRDLAARLASAAAPVALARHDGRDHPVFAALDVSLRGDLRSYLEGGGRRPVEFAELHGAARVDFAGDDPFFNVNTPEDLAHARRRMIAAGHCRPDALT